MEDAAIAASLRSLREVEFAIFDITKFKWSVRYLPSRISSVQVSDGAIVATGYKRR